MPAFPPQGTPILREATRTLAALTSLMPGQADYVTDGTNDETDLNNAIGDLNS